jgi:hypothetical protein
VTSRPSRSPSNRASSTSLDSVDGEFEFGLERVLDGIDALVRSRGRTP